MSLQRTRRRSRRRDTTFALAATLGLLFGTLGASPPPAQASPATDQYVVMSGWQVGATAQTCLSLGNGAFAACQSLPLTDGQPDGTSTIGEGDWNNDGIGDLVVANQNGTLNTCIQSVAGGSWTCQSNGQTGRHRGIGVGDFNGDGNQDIVGGIETMSNMDVCLGDGTGGFTCSRVAAPNGGRGIVTGDYDADGDIDLAYGAFPGPSAICANDGAANFTCTGLTGPTDNIGVDQADLNNDGHMDLAFAGAGSTDEYTCLGNSTGAFTCTSFNTGGYHSGIKFGHLDNDGNLDIVVGGGTTGIHTQKCLGDGNNGFTCSNLNTFLATNVADLDLGDINNDGNLDVVVGQIGINEYCTGDGNGGFPNCGSIDSANSWNTQGILVMDPYVAPPPDADSDGVPDASDNCVNDANPAQTNTDGDAEGDVCDLDDDNDTLTDVAETGTHGTDPLLADTDSDNLDDNLEINTHATNPNLPDSDLDSLSDGDEVNIHGTNPLAIDTDADTLTDGDEVLVHGTDPLSDDTDNDTLLDAAELNVHATSPLLADSDSDNLDDGLEVNTYATNPNLPDSDLDSLGDGDEIANGTDPLATDTDNDTLTDGDEVLVHGTDPLSNDTDNDTLLDAAELNIHATNPLLADTDSDNLDDPDEINIHATNPNLPDSDLDSLGDGDEIANGTDPLATDTDNDTLTDGDEVLVHGTDPLSNDTDGDNLTDADEINVHATNPLDADSDGDGIDDDVEIAFGSDPNLVPQPQTISFPQPAGTTFDTGDFGVAVATSSGLTVDVTATGACTISSYTVTPTGAGDCTLTASQAGDYAWLPAADVTHVVTISPGIQTISFFAFPDPSTFGDGPTPFVVATTSGLPVTATALGTCTVDGPELVMDGAGTCAVAYDQPGNADWAPAPTESQIFTIDPAAQVITLAPPATFTHGDDGVDLVANATSTLPVAISVAGPCDLTGVTLTPLGAGTCTLTYDQAGDTDWLPAPTATATVEVLPSPQAITLTVPEEHFFDEPDADIVAVAESNLPVDVVATGACTLDGTVVTSTGAGDCTLTANQAGDADWLAAPTVVETFETQPGRQTITITPPVDVVFGQNPLDLEVVASSDLPVTAATNGPCAVDGLTLTIGGGGVCSITFSQDGDADWAPADDELLDVSVDKASQVITLPPIDDTAFGSGPITVAPSATSELDIELTAAGDCALDGDQLELLAAGSCTVTAVQDGDDDWLAATTVVRSFDIAKGSASLLVDSTTVGFSDEPQPATVTTEPAELDGVTIRYDGRAAVPREPGEYDLTVELDHPDWEAEPFEGTFTVLDPPEDIPEGYRFVSASIDEIVEDGLPEPSAGGMLLTVTGIEEDTVATLSDPETDIEATADETASLGLDIAPTFDLAEATLAIVAPDGTAAVVSTEEIFEFGESRMELEFEIEEGDDVGTGELAMLGEGLAPSSLLDVVVHSDPINVGTLQTDEDGAFTGRLQLPAELEPGEHRVLVQAATGNGSVTGTWFFAVEENGTVERLGDPDIAVPAPSAAPGGPIDAAERVVADLPTAQEADTAPVVIDEDTGLIVYDPVSDPEQSVDAGVNGFALLTVATAAGGSVAALSSMSSGGATGMGGTSSGGSVGGNGAIGGRRRDSNDGSGDGDGDGKSRGKGKVASGKAKGLGGSIEGAAWGDGSVTWRWPWVAGLDRVGREIPDRIRPVSPLLARIAADGSTLRAALGTAAVLAQLLGITLGIMAAANTGGLAIAPTSGFMMALILLGIFDASAGFLAAVSFSVSIFVAGGLESADSVRTVMGVASLWYAIPLVAGGARKFRRAVAANLEESWSRVADVVVGSLLGAWTCQTVLKALPGLAGLDLPIAAKADTVALLALAALVGRYLLETIAIGAYPERLAMTAPIEERENGKLQEFASIAVKAGMFVFVISPFIGMVWQLGAVVVLMLTPQLLGLMKDNFPNSRFLHRILPKGVPSILIFMVLGKQIAAVLADRIDDPATLTLTSFVVLSVPGFLTGMAGLFGRDGDDLVVDWVGRAAGILVASVAFFTIRGALSATIVGTLVICTPALAWWAFTAWRAGLAPADDEVDGEGDGGDDPGADPGERDKTLQPA